MFDFYKGLTTLFMERNGQISLNHPFYYTPPTHTHRHTHTHTHTQRHGIVMTFMSLNVKEKS